MAVLPVGAVTTPFTATPITSTSIPDVTGSRGSTATQATSFGDLLAKGLENVNATQETASTRAGELATGQLGDVSDFTTAAAKANLAVSLTAAVRNRAIEAYQEIMRMQV